MWKQIDAFRSLEPLRNDSPALRNSGEPYVSRSGNPKDRPPKKECLTSLLKEELEQINPADREGRSWKELVVAATLRLAINGNVVALREVWDRVDGKVRQDVGLKTNVSDNLVRRLEEARARAAFWDAPSGTSEEVKPEEAQG
jgi:hypothetical protein